MVDPKQQPPVDIEDISVDDGQSAFWDTQAVVQAPPIEPVSPATKKRQWLVIGGVVFVLLLLVMVALLPERQLTPPQAEVPVTASPTPVPLSSGWKAEFANIDALMEVSNPDNLIPPPRVDMEVEF